MVLKIWNAIVQFLKALFGKPKPVMPVLAPPIPRPGPVIVVPEPSRAPFYALIRAKLGPLNQSQVDGFEFLFKKWDQSGLKDLRWFAYMLATVWHETAMTMQPVTEYGSNEYLKSKRYYPYIGRGYVQLTWRENYEKYGIADHPEKALDPEMAAHILFDGMVKGKFTGRSLSDYFNARTTDPVGARYIVNGQARAELIAGLYGVFEQALEDIPPASVRLAQGD